MGNSYQCGVKVVELQCKVGGATEKKETKDDEYGGMRVVVFAGAKTT